jgi:hypothetical protein
MEVRRLLSQPKYRLGDGDTPSLVPILWPLAGNLNGRGGEIRTRDLYVPNVALYQAKLRPDLFAEGPKSLLAGGVASRKRQLFSGSEKMKLSGF